MSLKRSSRRCSSCNKSQSTTLKLQNTSILSIYRWGQAFDHWCLSMCFFFGHTWLYKGVTFVFLLSFPLPFDWTLRCWVCVCCFVLLYFGYYVVLCVKNKKLLITKNIIHLWFPWWGKPGRNRRIQSYKWNLLYNAESRNLSKFGWINQK